MNATHKLNRARFHIDDLAQRIREYEASNPIKHKQTETKIIIEREKSYPVDMALTLGDAIHNLRTALDMLASDLVQLNGGDAKNVYFPFTQNAKELEKQIKEKRFDRAGPAAVQRVLEIDQGEDGKYLRGLHLLDIMDKHQLILPVEQSLRINELRVSGSTGEFVADISARGDGISVSAKPGDKATWDSIKYTPTFGSDVPEVFRGQPIIETLKELSDIVNNIIKLFGNLNNAGS